MQKPHSQLWQSSWNWSSMVWPASSWLFLVQLIFSSLGQFVFMSLRPILRIPVLLPGKIPWMGEPGRLQSMGLLKVGHDWETSLSLFTFMHWRRKWQPTQVFLPWESQGRGSLMGCHLWGHTESDTTEATQQQQQQQHQEKWEKNQINKLRNEKG